ncbi:MAG: hypothetical protein QMD53_02790 [Actinomycetota bacterium]|nr:hypothetical protein [Actinomycetota bacterium]
MNTDNNQEKTILISDRQHGLPFSKGLIASSIMATGISPLDAYDIARSIEDRLKSDGTYSIKSPDLSLITIEMIESKVGLEYAKKYENWLTLGKLDRPLIVLIGGTTGVGKSTIATEIGNRLGITHIVPSDAIREVMRKLLSKELMPVLYHSSFDAWRAARIPVCSGDDPVIEAFMEQAIAVGVGLSAVIQRAITEGFSMIIEGVHLVPGLINLNRLKDALIVQLVIAMGEEELHKSHFYVREVDTGGTRSFKRYRANFESIRKVGGHLEAAAREEKVAIIPSYHLDEAVIKTLEVVLDRVVSCCAKVTQGTQKSNLK